MISRFAILLMLCVPTFVTGCGSSNEPTEVPVLEDASVYEAEEERAEEAGEAMSGEGV